MKVSLIACVNEKLALGKNGDLLYHISPDLKNFRLLTEGRVVIMGRKTWDSLPNKCKPLPKRTNIVVSKTQGTPLTSNNEEEFLDEETPFVTSLEDALKVADMFTLNDDEEVFIIGGASLYQEAIEKRFADRIYLTEVQDDEIGDVYFPDIEKNVFWDLRFVTDYMDDGSDKHLRYRYKIFDSNSYSRP